MTSKLPTANTVNLHARPIDNSIKKKISLPLEIKLRKFLKINDPNATRSSSTSAGGEFAINVTKPVIVLTSEFIPLYQQQDTIQLTTQGAALSLKEYSNALTTATVTSVLSQIANVTELARNNKIDLKEFLDSMGNSSNETKIGKFFNDFNSLESKIYPSSFRYESSAANSFGEFVKYLGNVGHNQVHASKYSESKLWLQALVEFKRSMMSYTTSLKIASRGVRAEDSLPNTICKSGASNVYLNPYASPLPFLNSLASYKTFIDDDEIDEISDSRAAIKQTEETLYSKHDSTEKLTEDFFKDKPYTLSSSDDDLLFSVFNVLKEINYSKFIVLNKDSEVMRKIGYTVDVKNYKIWDAIFGNIPASATGAIVPNIVDVPETKALCSLSQYTILPTSDNVKKVLTFESSPSSNNISGWKYFFEENINKAVNTQSTDDNDNITLFSNYCTGYLAAIDTISTLIEDSQNLARDSLLNLHHIKTKLLNNERNPTFIYKKMHLIQSGYIQGPYLPRYDIVRFHSVLCKFAISSAPGSSDLKADLFMWFMIQIYKNFITAATPAGISLTLLSTLSRDYESKMLAILLTKQAESYNHLSNSDFMNLLNTKEILQVANINDFSSTDSFFPLIKDLLLDVYRDDSLFISTNTGYSGINKPAFLYAYFDMLLRIIASQTPESFIAPVRRLASDPAYFVKFTPLLPVTDYFNFNAVSVLSAVKLVNVETKLLANKTQQYNDLTIFYSFVENIKTQTSQARSLLSTGNFPSYISTFKSLSSGTTPPNLIKSALSKNQLKLSTLIYSELRDTTRESSNSSQVPLVSTINPALSGINPIFLPIDQLGMVSFQLLSSFYTGPEFQSNKGNNKRIIAVGIPHGLIDSIQTAEMKKNRIMSGYIKVKIWLLDRLYPDILFHPKEYIFDMNRFPTRSLDNWDLSSAVGNDKNKIPTKFYSPYQNRFYLHRNLNEAKNLIGLTSTEKNDLPPEYDELGDHIATRGDLIASAYINHSTSFLCEEYLRWYTDISFNETNFYIYRYSASNNTVINYQNVVNAIKSSANNTPSTSSNIAKFSDPAAKNIISVPVRQPLNNFSSSIPKNTTPTSVDLTNSTTAYLKNQSYMSDKLELKRKVLYPKKFDRVFHLLVDADDFKINNDVLSDTRKDELKLDTGRFADSGNNTISKIDTRQEDLSLQEFFVSVESIPLTGIF